jgi:hypothetical protein
MLREDNSTLVFVAHPTISDQLADAQTFTDYTLLEEGEIAIIDNADNTTMLDSAGALTDSVRIVQRIGNRLVSSADFLISDVIRHDEVPYSAAAEQVDNIGYIGSGSLDIDAQNDTDYKLTLDMKYNDGLFAEQGNTYTYNYTSDSSATSAEIASAFAARVNADSHNVSAVMLCDNAGLALGTGCANADEIFIANGSTTMWGFDDVDDATTNAAIEVGDYLRFSTSTLALTDAVYRVVSIDTTANTLELNMPFQGTTHSGDLDDTDIKRIPAATAATAKFGIKLTGEDLGYGNGWVVGEMPYMKVKWDTNTSGWGTTTVTKTTAASNGSGEYEQIAELEWFALGGHGVYDRAVGHPVATAVNSLQAANAQNYDVVTLEVYTDGDTNGIQNSHVIASSSRPKQMIYLCFPTGIATQSDKLTKVFDNVVKGASSAL